MMLLLALSLTATLINARLLAEWYDAVPGVVQELPYLYGTQAEVQWRIVQTQPDEYNFTALDLVVAEKLAQFNDSRKDLVKITIQINGNEHPDFIFEKVPYCNNDTASWAHENLDKQGVPAFWHPFFVRQYRGLIIALANHLATTPYHGHVLGVRQNWNAAGTESYWVPVEHRDLSQWYTPPGATPLNQTFSHDIAQWYANTVVQTHLEAFVLNQTSSRRTLVLIRNDIKEEVRNSTVQGKPLMAYFNTGQLGWFHTSSEIEPRPQNVVQYTTFLEYCKPGTTVCYAEPWADAWGQHGIITDPRWASPPQFEYWRLLSDLHMGIKNIAIYGNDLSVAAYDRYPDTTGPILGHNYKQEFQAAFEFAHRYSNYSNEPNAIQGAFIAFRVSISNRSGYNHNVTDYYQHLTLVENSTAFAGLDARVDGQAVPVLPNLTKANMSSIGPYHQRYGAWARRLSSEYAVKLELDAAATQAWQRSGINATIVVTLLSQDPVDVSVTVASTTRNATCSGMQSWQTIQFDFAYEEHDVIKFVSNADIIMHMIEVYWGRQAHE